MQSELEIQVVARVRLKPRMELEDTALSARGLGCAHYGPIWNSIRRSIIVEYHGK